MHINVVRGNVHALMPNCVLRFNLSVKRDLLVRADMQKIQLVLLRLGHDSGDWYSWEHGSFASFSREFDPPILHQDK
jgi:hypothetical protein